MSDERFFDLALRVCARQSTDAERAELESMIANRPELRAELDQLQADARLAREVLPLMAAVEASSGEFPAYARERLQTKVRETLAGGVSPKKKSVSRWYWWMGLASATAVTAVVLVSVLSRPAEPTIQVAMLDLAGATRGSHTNEMAVLAEAWKQATTQEFSRVAELKAWEKDWPGTPSQFVAKIIYDRAAGEVRILIRWKDQRFEKTFPVDSGLAAAAQQAKVFVQEYTRR